MGSVTTEFGPNDWLVDEMFRKYAEDPESVSESWREFFADYRPRAESPVPSRPAAELRTQPPQPVADKPSNDRSAVEDAAPDKEDRGRAVRGPASAAERSAAGPREEQRAERAAAQALEDATPLRGPQAAIVKNMEASLRVPTATSVRTMPAKLLEENRRIVNDYLARGRGGKVSFTHLIGWAIVRALQSAPALNSSYEEIDGKPHVVRHKNVNLGLAVDQTRKDGTRTLLVPNIKAADTLDFAGFHAAYEDIIRRVRAGKLQPDDFAGTTVSLTNPGMIGTELSVPRLMAGQGAIIGAGAIDYPTEYKGTDPDALATLGVGKVVTLTSTYDHRVIQGAESGEFLDAVERLLAGEDHFYDEVFAALEIPYEPVRWSRDTATAIAGAPDEASEKAGHVLQLINMYRVRGHLIADLNPLVREARQHNELDPGFYGLGVWDLDRVFFADGLAGRDHATLRDILGTLRAAYCGTVGVEYMHIQEADEKRWIQEHVEGVERDIPQDAKLRLLDRLNAAEAFERFLHTKYIGHKRFSLEGAESLIPMLHTLLDAAAEDEVAEAVMGMSHRGRLNVLTNVVGKSYVQVFHDFEGDIDPDTTQGSGDVQYHLGASGVHTSPTGATIAVSVASNPSHLEAVNPVVEGVARARQDSIGGANRHDTVLPVLIHGDAAFAGQGVVQETLNLSQLRGYRTGGTVHIVVNNLIGFTAGPDATRTSVYATDVAKMIQAPILHVNGDDPEACTWVSRVAYEYRMAFHKDIVIDMQCYRRWGHNETDEPAFTQPVMYGRIDEHRSVRKLYTEALINRGDITLEEAEQALEDFRRRLDEALDQTKAEPRKGLRARRPAPPRGVRPHIDTGVDRAVLDKIIAALRSYPEGFQPHPKLERIRMRSLDQFDAGSIDWALAEALSWGSLILEGTRVRLSGQDSRRGTFSQRHAVLVDHRTGDEYTPLEGLAPPGSWRFVIFDSLLSEYAALGFEYGYSVGDPNALVMWEAQFGDFVNGAQIVVDQYVVASENKWRQTCGVVLLLPHGFEGQGPEHSSARIERFLTLCAEDNIQVAYPTLPAQYFHLLRRQVHMTGRKPLVVFTPKSLLRHPRARSASDELTRGSFEEVLADHEDPDPAGVRRVALCSGKVAVDLAARREELGTGALAIVRLEQLYPFPHVGVQEQVARYPNAEVVWVQEEPENMGAWRFVFAHLQHQYRDISVIARPESASPAAGSKTVHEQEQEDLLEEAFDGLA
jgi:2-oxoglutarate dehydrogenase E1 component